MSGQMRDADKAISGHLVVAVGDVISMDAQAPHDGRGWRASSCSPTTATNVAATVKLGKSDRAATIGTGRDGGEGVIDAAKLGGNRGEQAGTKPIRSSGCDRGQIGR